jgi:thiamine pyrophosphokinase
MNRTAVPAAIVFAGNGRVEAAVRARLPQPADVIAADSGLTVASALGLAVDHLVGDLDSVDPAAIEAAEAGGTTVDRHPAEKDATDLELALDAALSLHPRRILVLAPAGGRLDHELAGLLLLASERYAGVRIDALVGEARVHVVRSSRELTGEPGELVTLLAVNGPAEGVTTEGLVYPLHGETLEPGSSRGVSNVLGSETARVELTRGVLLAVRPGVKA